MPSTRKRSVKFASNQESLKKKTKAILPPPQPPQPVEEKDLTYR